jgi:hypothetical protein
MYTTWSPVTAFHYSGMHRGNQWCSRIWDFPFPACLVRWIFKSSKTSFLVSDCLIVEHRRISSSESILDSDSCCIRLDFYISGVISTTRNLVSDSLIVERVTVVAVIRFPNRNRRLLASILDCLRSFCSSSHRFYDRGITQSFASKTFSSAQSSIIRRCAIEISRL